MADVQRHRDNVEGLEDPPLDGSAVRLAKRDVAEGNEVEGFLHHVLGPELGGSRREENLLGREASPSRPSPRLVREPHPRVGGLGSFVPCHVEVVFDLSTGMGVVEGVEEEGSADVGVRVPWASAQALGNGGEESVGMVADVFATRGGRRSLEGSEGAKVGAGCAPEFPQVVFDLEVVLLQDGGVGEG